MIEAVYNYKLSPNNFCRIRRAHRGVNNGVIRTRNESSTPLSYSLSLWTLFFPSWNLLSSAHPASLRALRPQHWMRVAFLQHVPSIHAIITSQRNKSFVDILSCLIIFSEFLRDRILTDRVSLMRLAVRSFLQSSSSGRNFGLDSTRMASIFSPLILKHFLQKMAIFKIAKIKIYL